MATGVETAGTRDGFEPKLFDRLEAIGRLDDAALADNAESLADELIETGETVLEAWLEGHGKPVDVDPVEGFRLLGLHRAGARGDPSFNACRETSRELVYRTNCARRENDVSERARQLRLGVMVARHLALFIDGKLETEGLGEFCCSSRTLRTGVPDGGSPAQTLNGSE